MTEKIEIGQELPKERWERAKDSVAQLAEIIAPWLLTLNHDGMGKEDAEAVRADLLLAAVALNYVAECAVDKCRFIPVPEVQHD